MESKRLQRVPSYLFSDLDRKQEALQAQGMDVINLGVGDPDLPPPPHVVEALRQALNEPANHRYPPYAGTKEFREAVAQWYQRRFGVSLDPDREVLALIGSKEGLAHLPWALLDPGDVALVPDPGYPVYKTAVLLADGEPFPVPLDPQSGFLPDLETIPPEIARRAKVFFLNYPNNPTAGVATKEFFRDLVKFAQDYGIILVQDNSYSEIAYDGYRPPSLLEVEGAKEVGIEFHSLSKTYCITGWRIGFVVGNPKVVGALGKLKTNLDSGVFRAIQHAGTVALNGPQDEVLKRLEVFQRRRDLVVNRLRELGWEVPLPKATFYIWLRTPDGSTARTFAETVLMRTGVVVTPGSGYGERGEGYVRLSITVPDARLEEALNRITEAFKGFGQG
ncbi:MAG: LL-diaminopimelate aminotransferase [Armatimonadota bacterium]|nr:LL-diaminopimelate aminotransferase [Armatimonadota bacterium]